MIITSVQNEGVKAMRQLKQKRSRRETGLHFIEGERLVADAISSHAEIVFAYVAEGWSDRELLERNSIPYAVVTPNVMRALSDTEAPQGICASVKTPSAVPPEKYPAGLIVALDGLRDPGNLGTILRTADAFGAAGIITSADTVDAYSPKALRAAMGSTYHLPVWSGELLVELNKLAEAGASLVCGHLGGSEELPSMSVNRALVIGSEANGVTEPVAAICQKYRIPMKGNAESLNAAVAAAILVYELSKA